MHDCYMYSHYKCNPATVNGIFIVYVLIHINTFYNFVAVDMMLKQADHSPCMQLKIALEREH